MNAEIIQLNEEKQKRQPLTHFKSLLQDLSENELISLAQNLTSSLKNNGEQWTNDQTLALISELSTRIMPQYTPIKSEITQLQVGLQSKLRCVL